MTADLVPVVGLEVHVQLRTATKMFCADQAAYGGPPNTRVCPVCLGLPGALPVLNRRAVELGVIAALGLHCTVHPASHFERKSYFYPDLPKGFQITQQARPLATGGHLDISAGRGVRRVRIRRVHLEEDAGRSLGGPTAAVTAVDFNRAGLPLLEIVTEPELGSPEDARDFLVRLRQALRYLGVSDCDMEEGGLRVDANVSVRIPGEELGVSTELKNMNSFGGVERAIRGEIARQISLRRSGQRIAAATLMWDAAASEVRPTRRKESPEEYRYLPEPDLPPLDLDVRWLERLGAELPEMPWTRAERLCATLALPLRHAQTITASRGTADYYEDVVSAGAGAGDAASWVMGEVLAAASAAACEPRELRIQPSRLAELIDLVRRGKISRPAARRVFDLMLRSDDPPAELVARERLELEAGEEAIEAWVDEALRAHPAEAARMLAGERKLVAYFVGRVMRSSGGRADPVAVGRAVAARISAD